MKLIAIFFTLIIASSIANPVLAADPLDDLFPSIESPYDEKVGNQGIIGFINVLIQIAAISAGIFTMINLILAGFYYLTANGEPKNIQIAWQKINFSLIGLLIIIASFTLAILIGQIFFGSPTYIINPKIITPE